ncbi:MAG: SUMF1/EgtB/PvdO family nonheme iron enzyme [Chitinophagales bacterium]|nr:SUMF1/EgtB/PvdO family nonheme iron enzyme [Chitinophagales bacterium]
MKLFCCTSLVWISILVNAPASIAQNIDKENVTIPGTSVSFQMAHLPAGKFIMGSKPSEPGRGENEGYHEVSLDGFWMGVCEVTWDEFYCFQFRHMDADTAKNNVPFSADAIARPTPPYFDFTYGRGRAGGFPAATMTQQAAMRYCQWLSDKTGDFYRLPTEAEWEYACRAGGSTAFSWGEKPGEADQYAWFYDNSSGSYQKVGTKKPNAWGLFDMHGNVAEWTLDFYADQYFTMLDSSSVNPMIFPLKKHSRTVKGGGFEDYTPQLRCANRRKSDPKWQARDPQIPKSKWWNPDSPFVGFRIIREEKPVTKEQRDAFFAKAIKD